MYQHRNLRPVCVASELDAFAEPQVCLFKKGSSILTRTMSKASTSQRLSLGSPYVYLYLNSTPSSILLEPHVHQALTTTPEKNAIILRDQPHRISKPQDPRSMHIYRTSIFFKCHRRYALTAIEDGIASGHQRR